MSEGRTRLLVQGLAGAALVLHGTAAEANTEPAAAYDAQSVALGGTGVAYVHNGASMYHNPAALEGIGKLALTGVLSLSAPESTVPLNGPDTSVSSDATPFPLFLVGGAYRVFDSLVVGMAVYPSAGFGSVYKDVELGGQKVDLDQSVMMMEATPSVSVRLVEGLSLGVGYRIVYTKQSAEQLVPLPAPPGAPPGPPQFAETKVELSGTSFKGLNVGLFAQPFQDTRIGLSYRNRFDNHLEGTVSMMGREVEAEAEIGMPHSFRFGVAQALLDQRLLLVGEVKRSLYADSNKEIVTKMEGLPDMVVVLDWQNTWTVGGGVQYTLPSSLAFRGGYSAAESASSEDYASYYMTPPVLLHTVHAGAGYRLGAFDLGVAGFYSWGSKYVEPLPPTNAGEYSTKFIDFTVSISYLM